MRLTSAQRALIAFVATLMFLLTPSMYLAKIFQSGSGDLTRIAHLRATDFAPKINQPDLNIVATESPAKADVLVLGDSFSAENNWQTVFASQAQLGVATWRIKDSSCVDAWLERAIAQGLSKQARVLVLQTIERAFVDRLVATKQTCKDRHFLPWQVRAHLASGKTSATSLLPIDLRHVTRTIKNSLAPELKAGRFVLRKAVVVDLVRDDLFSNHLSSRLLYLRDDEQPSGSWNADQVRAGLERFANYQCHAAKKGLALYLVVIPDKSTVYAPWIANDQRPEMPELGLYPLLGDVLGEQANLLPAFRRGAEAQVDFFNPNDTHLSLSGYRLLANELATYLKLPR